MSKIFSNTTRYLNAWAVFAPFSRDVQEDTGISKVLKFFENLQVKNLNI